MKHIFKQLIPYLIALAIGFIIMFLITPYAQSQRPDPTRVGGEALIPILAMLLVLIVRNIRNDMRASVSDDEDNE